MSDRLPHHLTDEERAAARAARDAQHDDAPHREKHDARARAREAFWTANGPHAKPEPEPELDLAASVAVAEQHLLRIGPEDPTPLPPKPPEVEEARYGISVSAPHLVLPGDEAVAESHPLPSDLEIDITAGNPLKARSDDHPIDAFEVVDGPEGVIEQGSRIRLVVVNRGNEPARFEGVLAVRTVAPR